MEVLKQAIGSIRFFLTASIGVLKGEEVGQSRFFLKRSEKIGLSSLKALEREGVIYLVGSYNWITMGNGV